MREFPPARATTPTERDVYTIERLNQAARQLVESRFALIWVEGEISNLSRPGSGHMYFTLKDGSAQIRCALFRGRRTSFGYSPSEGNQVLVRARLTIYAPRGDLQLVVQHIEPAGEGALREQFDRLKNQLQQEGLFDEERKKKLPEIPHRIGVVTSPSGAAVRDIVATCRRRFAAIPLVIYPTPVQGRLATDGIVQSLRVAVERNECDVLILARGGGSLEDLWAFNEERVARAVAECGIPLVTGIGHETDFTIADFIADQRAATPTAAAELVVPDDTAIAHGVHTARMQLISAISRKIQQAMQRNDIFAHRLIHPTRRYAQVRHQFHLLYNRLYTALNTAISRHDLSLTAASERLLRQNPQHRLNNARWRLQTARRRLGGLRKRLTVHRRQRFQASLARLNAVNPLATLQRGYALVTDDSGAVVSQAEQVQIGADISVKLARGRLIARVEEKLE